MKTCQWDWISLSN